MTKFKQLIDTKEDLLNSIMEFHNKPEFWKVVLGPNPIYFIHINHNGSDIFGFSKFCALKNITIEQYIASKRNIIQGTLTQKHISNLTRLKWVKFENTNLSIQKSFHNWITEFFPTFQVTKASIITLQYENFNEKEKFVSPEDLFNKLKLQKEIGEVGELIAIEYERKRLTDMKGGIFHIDHVSKSNSSAGFDLLSSIKLENRYIEVKSSLSNNLEFYITENEIHTLSTLAENAYLYIVHITDLQKHKGKVIFTIPNPIRFLQDSGTLNPIAYKVKIHSSNSNIPST